MSEETSLTDFVIDGSSGDDELTDLNKDDESADSSPQTEPDSRLSTYAWGTYVCSACDSSVERVWREDEAFVCHECKQW